MTNSTPIFKRVLLTLTTFIFAFSTTSTGFAASAEKKYSHEQKMAAYVRFAGGMPVQNFNILLSAASKIDESSLNTIRTDLEYRMGSTKMPKFSMKSNQVMIDGKGTGVRVMSYDPVTVTYKNKEWKYKKDLSVAQNYFSLGNFINGEKTNASVLNLLIEPAYADRAKQFGYTIAGIVVGVGVGIVAIVATGSAVGFLPVAALVALMAVGGGYLGRDSESKAEAARNLLVSGVAVTCKGGSMTVSAADSRNKASLSVDASTGLLQLKDSDGTAIDSEKISSDLAPMVASLRTQAGECKDSKDAKKLEEEINSFAEVIRTMKSNIGACQLYGADAKVFCDPTKIRIMSSKDGSRVEVFTATSALLDAKGAHVASPSEQMKTCVNALRAELVSCKKPDDAKALQAKINQAPAANTTSSAVQ